MRSERLYYRDAYSTRFSATIWENSKVEGRPAVILNRSLFYPQSGGQPADTGMIGGRPVVDVFVREDDQAVVHVLDQNPESDEIAGEIDWPRRFDHMQQHTGQHILSRSLVEILDAHTFSFHLGEKESTIDVSVSNISVQSLRDAELLANQIIWENRPVDIEFHQASEVTKLPVRSIPNRSGDNVRLIRVRDFDLTACGGTHVAQTGEIGQIKIVRTENHRGGTRLAFICGQRSLKGFQQTNRIVQQLSVEFTTGSSEILNSVNKTLAESKESSREIKRLRNKLAAIESDEVAARGIKISTTNVIVSQFLQREPEEIRTLANRLCRKPDTIVLFALNDSKLHLFFCRSEDAPGEMNVLLKIAIKNFSSMKGGGSQKFAQATGPPAQPDRINKSLTEVQQYLLETLR